MTANPAGPPLLSTPDTHILEDDTPVIFTEQASQASDEELFVKYEIDRTLLEIRRGRYRRIALQFPDDMLSDAPRIYQLLSRGVKKNPPVTGQRGIKKTDRAKHAASDDLPVDVSQLSVEDIVKDTKFTILADTSYGSCCVDEISAEHVNAEVVVHYGRSCLSPTARLPVINVFTQRDLNIPTLVQAFKVTFPNTTEKIILAAELMYTEHLPSIHEALVCEGYTQIFNTQIKHDPSSHIPNRTVPDSAAEDPAALRGWQLFHISEPPTALLLTLSSRVASIHVYPTDHSDTALKPLVASTALALRRRYAILTSLNTVSIFGILINTLSVKNYLHIVDHVKEQIAAAGKKSYLFVVGKLNAAKVANFSEIGGWVVIGCWESSLVDSKDFYKPVITPFELELALRSDEERVWTGEWRSDYQRILDRPLEKEKNSRPSKENMTTDQDDELDDNGDFDSEPESAPPEFDLRTGRYVSHTRPMHTIQPNIKRSGIGEATVESQPDSTTLTRRYNGDLSAIRGIASPAAAFLQSKRAWKGLGSDFDAPDGSDGFSDQESTAVAEGRSGIARGYTVGDEDHKH